MEHSYAALLSVYDIGSCKGIVGRVTCWVDVVAAFQSFKVSSKWFLSVMHDVTSSLQNRVKLSFVTFTLKSFGEILLIFRYATCPV